MGKFSLIILSLFLLWVVAVKLVAPSYLKSKVAEHKLCETCELEFRSITPALFDVSRFTIKDIHLTQGKRGLADLEASVSRIELNVDLFALEQQRLIVEDITVTKADIMYTDGELPKPPKPEPPKSEPSPWTFEVRRSSIERSRFAYRRVLHKEASVLTLNGITLEATVDDQVQVASKFQLERSGTVRLNFNFPVEQDELRVLVDVWIDDQNMADLNVFFEKNDGVVLKGLMKEAEGHVDVKGEKLTARVKAIYEGFSAKMLKNEDNGAVESFFTTLGIKLVTKRKNNDPTRESIERERKEDESIVQFILQGLKEAALEVATSPEKK